MNATKIDSMTVQAGVVDRDNTTLEVRPVKVRRKRGKRARLKPGSPQRLAEAAKKPATTSRDRLRRRLLVIVRKMMAAAESEIDFANLKIVYGLLLQDEAAQFERHRVKFQAEAEAKAQALNLPQSSEEMQRVIRHVLGKEVHV